MQLWMTSYARRERGAVASITSVAAHALVIGVWIVATLPQASLPFDSLPNHLYYIPPPDKPPPTLGSRESVRYVAFGVGDGLGPGPAAIDPKKPIAPPMLPTQAGGPAPDSTPPAQPATAPVAGTDSVFTILEVDTAVVRSQSSAAPAYPLDLLAKHIEGVVVVRYVVDTTGFADTASFRVVRTTNEGFVTAVRDVLPYMRFSPAKIGPTKVRQLVEQPFTFRISPTLASTPKP